MDLGIEKSMLDFSTVYLSTQSGLKLVYLGVEPIVNMVMRL